MYSIRYDASLDLLDVVWSGLFTPDVMIKYAADCRECLKRERFRDGFRLRVELSDDQPLSQETLKVLNEVFVDYPKPCRTAVVTRSAIVRMQTKRAMMLDPNTETFTSTDDALEWLTASDVSPNTNER